MRFSILKKRVGIETQVDDFLDRVSEAGLLFKCGVDSYLRGDLAAFEKKLEQIVETEHAGDSLRRSLEELLYTRTLIPESRGDVLELLEQMDALLDRFKGAMWRFEIERPVIAPEFGEDFRALADCSVESVEAIVCSARAFFNDISSVNNHMHKVMFWETEADKVATRLQRSVFRSKHLDLSHRMQLQDFVRHVVKISDRAEDVADRLSIYVIKRLL